MMLARSPGLLGGLAGSRTWDRADFVHNALMERKS